MLPFSRALSFLSGIVVCCQYHWETRPQEGGGIAQACSTLCEDLAPNGAGRPVRAGRLGRLCVKDDMNELGLHSEWVVFRDMWRSLISGKTSDPS